MRATIMAVFILTLCMAGCGKYGNYSYPGPQPEQNALCEDAGAQDVTHYRPRMSGQDPELYEPGYSNGKAEDRQVVVVPGNCQ